MKRFFNINPVLVFICLFIALWGCQSNEMTIVSIDTPDEAEVFSHQEHFSITVKGMIDREKYNLPKDLDWLAHQIHIFVHPLQAEDWWRQNRATARDSWVAQAYLGGAGQYSAKDNERFEIVAVLTKEALNEKYNDLQGILSEPNTYRISEIKTVVTRRP
jgi:hypothetical protein